MGLDVGRYPRDPLGVGLGIVGMLLGLGGLYIALNYTLWMLLVAVPLFTVGAFGTVIEFSRPPR